MSKPTFQKLKANYIDLEFYIEEDLPEVGFYLYVYKSNECIYNSLQDSVEDCKEIAFEMYGVRLNDWIYSKI